MRYLLLSSLVFFILLLPACRSVYKDLQTSQGDIRALEKFRPVFNRALYNTQVNVVGHHLSGLLLIKTMPDSSIRMVFSNEMGFKFFDFEFRPQGGFKVYYIIKKMDKKAVITTLRKDFELILMQNLNSTALTVLQQDQLIYYRFLQEKGYNYYIANKDGSNLVRMERSSSRKPVTIVIMKDYVQGIPDTIGITHKKFNFTIGLKRTE